MKDVVQKIDTSSIYNNYIYIYIYIYIWGKKDIYPDYIFIIKEEVYVEIIVFFKVYYIDVYNL